MRRTTDNEALLREYVRNALNEDDFGGGFGGYDAGYGYGVSFGNKNDLYKAFIEPFVDVFKTAVGKTKEVTRKARTLLTVSIQTVLTTIIPVYGANYLEIFDKEKDDIEKLRSEYKEVYDRTDEALKSNDAALLAFMACPEVVLGAYVAKQAPKAIKSLLSTLSGGISDELYDTIKSSAKSAGRWSLGSKGSSGKKNPKDINWSGMGEGKLNEAEGPGKEIGPKDILKSKKMINAVVQSNKAQKMKSNASAIYKKTLNQVYSQAKETLSAKSLDDLEKLTKKKISKADEIRKLQGEERATAEKMLLDGVKKAMKEFYTKQLSDHVKKVISAGIPESAQYVKDYKSVIDKISRL